jgi:hypothetical protein
LFRWPTIRALARQLSGTAVQDSSADAAESTARQVMALERLAQAAKQARTRNG